MHPSCAHSPPPLPVIPGLQLALVTALTLEENEKKYFPAGKVARVVCAGKEGTRKIIAGIDGHTVHDQTLRARRLMEIVPGHGEIFRCDVVSRWWG